MRALFLGIDGGNSKTDIVLGTADGDVLGFVRGPTSSPHVVGLDGSMRVLGTLIAEVRVLAGVTTEIDVVAVYLAGADLPIEVSQLQQAIAAQRWARRSIVDNDCFALMRAGTSMPDAVAVVCGAGNNCVGRTADGRTARFPALGPISGDWGGGHDLAEYALRYAARGEDGRGAPTALTAAVARHFGRPTVESVSIALHLGELAMSAVPTLAPVLFEVAAAGDPVAGSLVRRQVEEVLAQHRVAAGRLGLLTEPHALVLGGGVLRARHPQLHDQVVAGATEQAPRVEISVVTTAPVVGAALLAMDALDTAGSAPAATDTAPSATGAARAATGATGVARAAERALRAAMNRPPTPAKSIAAAPSAAQSWTATPDGRAGTIVQE